MALTFLTGGVRSGKSRLAVTLAERYAGPVFFIATAEAGDAEMAARIAVHRAERPSGWHTVEAPRDLPAALSKVPDGAMVVIDCVSLWVSNELGAGLDGASIEAAARAVATCAAERTGPVVCVSNEVGSGIIPINALARTYGDVLGRVNQRLAAVAAPALLIVAGRALRLADPFDLVGLK